MKLLFLLILVGCEGSHAGPPTQAADPVSAGQAVAVFAGGCFWCMEGPFEKLEGVESVESGYTGGPEIRPSYRAVASGETGHFEAVRVVYSPAKVSYSKLLDVFWHNIDPTQSSGQFCDKGDQYRSAIFVSGASEQAQAESLVAEREQGRWGAESCRNHARACAARSAAGPAAWLGGR